MYFNIIRIAAAIAAGYAATSSKLGYHNWLHAVRVVERIALLIADIDVRYPQLILVAAAWHDAHHCGKTHRCEATGNCPSKELSNEEYAANACESYLRKYMPELTEEQIQFVRELILATSFGQDCLPKSDPRYRPYVPETLEQKLLAFADISNFLESYRTWEEFSLGLRSEIGNFEQSFTEWISNELTFLGYCGTRINEIQDLVSPEMLCIIKQRHIGRLDKLRNIQGGGIDVDGELLKKQFQSAA